MPKLDRDLEKARFSRASLTRSREMRDTYGVDIELAELPVVEPPPSTNRASRPDLYGRMLQGMGSSRTSNWPETGLNDTNVDPERRVATNQTDASGTRKTDRGGSTTRTPLKR